MSIDPTMSADAALVRAIRQALTEFFKCEGAECSQSITALRDRHKAIRTACNTLRELEDELRAAREELASLSTLAALKQARALALTGLLNSMWTVPLLRVVRWLLGLGAIAAGIFCLGAVATVGGAALAGPPCLLLYALLATMGAAQVIEGMDKQFELYDRTQRDVTAIIAELAGLETQITALRARVGQTTATLTSARESLAREVSELGTAQAEAMAKCGPGCVLSLTWAGLLSTPSCAA